MRWRLLVALLLTTAALFGLAFLPASDRRAVAGLGNAGSRADKDKSRAVPDEVIVRFDSGTDSDKRTKARGAVNAKVKKQLPVDGMQLLSLPAGTSPSTAAGHLENQPGVAYAEPNFSRHALGSVNDQYFPYEWGLHNTGQTINGTAGAPDADIDAPEAWDVTAGDPSVTVGVVDTGIDSTHPDLRDKIDPGYDFVDKDSDPTDLNGHGTHVSGTVAAAGNDGSGVAGVAYRTKVMPLRVLGADGSGSVADVISAYKYAADHGIRIVNASLGSDSSSRAERDAIASAPNTLFVVAAGNGGTDGVGDNVDQTPEYPCAYPLANIVCVAATDSSDQLGSFSNYGLTSVDIAAPGVDIASDWPTTMGSGYAWSDGTSMATPHVSGVAALVAARFADAGTTALKTAVLDGADHPATLTGKVAGGRRLNAYGAVTAPAPAPAPPTTTSPATTPSPAPPAARPAPEAPTPATPPDQPAPTPAPAPASADTTAPVISLKVASRIRSKTLRRGLRLVVSCSEACRADTRLVARSRALGRSTRALASAGRMLVTVHPTRTILRRWSRYVRRGTRLRLQLTVRDRAGNARNVLETVRVTG